LNIINTLIAATTKVIPIIITYIFVYAVPLLIGTMKLKIKGESFLPKSRLAVFPFLFVVIFVSSAAIAL